MTHLLYPLGKKPCWLTPIASLDTLQQKKKNKRFLSQPRIESIVQSQYQLSNPGFLSSYSSANTDTAMILTNATNTVNTDSHTTLPSASNAVNTTRHLDTGFCHLDTGFSRFPCVYKQTLRRFPTFQVATTCFSCSPPDLNLLVTNFIFCIHVK